MTSNGRVTLSPAADRVPSEPSMPPAYVEMLSRDGHDSVPAFLHATTRLFRGIDFRGKRVLEIGSGKGLLALYMAMQGAMRVVSLEPELVGATSGVIATQRRRVAILGLTNVDLVTADFNVWDPGQDRFDVILSRASLNHLYASDRHALHDAETYCNYLRIARQIRRLLEADGVFIATDACRYALFSLLRGIGVRRPWRWQRSGVNWRHHQNPGIWARIFCDAGFEHVTVDYPVPYRCRRVAAVANTAVANFFLQGTFILRARRGAHAHAVAGEWSGRGWAS
jgi:SAM-dependent methyltransferase